MQKLIWIIFEKKTVTLGEVLEHGLPTVESNFTKKLFKNYTPEEVVGKSIKDKRGGEITYIHGKLN